MCPMMTSAVVDLNHGLIKVTEDKQPFICYTCKIKIYINQFWRECSLICVSSIEFYRFWLQSIDSFCGTETPVIVVGTHAEGISKQVNVVIYM